MTVDKKLAPTDDNDPTKIVGSSHVLDAGQFFDRNKAKYLEEHREHRTSPFGAKFSDNCALCNPYEARRRWLASNTL